ncbi:hypothetical protein [Peribacillus sp. AS_2]|uniref:hypothetical protein n=1 Tax=Peribacillus sp. AS_2 TaxID=2996755 RepID=UPI0022A7DBB3|nr:hypothetical protein [Peribacillus sp. AS_2]MCZ0871249.1 hypothetical protein [Peribacillus sp. AS_2]
MNKRPGRKRLEYNQAELYRIIKHYRENVKPHGDIEYRKLYRYHLELHKMRPDICSKTYSDDFWRKKGQPGREAIDTANKIRMVTLVDGNDNIKDIPNVVDVVNKYQNKPELLIKHLQPLENEVRRSIQKERALKEKCDALKQELEQEKEKRRELKDKIVKYQDLLFKLFRYSDVNGTPLENQLDMNNKNKRIKKALDEVFDTPQDFYTSFEEQKTNKATKEDNIVPFTDVNKKKKRTLADDFDGRF